MRLQALVRTLYPPQCLGCETPVADDFGLCGTCWREMPFIVGLVCDCCGLPLPGTEASGRHVLCDECLRRPPPWSRGRAVALYDGLARRMVLQLKHGDRLDLARPLGNWLAQAALPLLEPDMLLAPVPLHWTRLLKRRANQSALLSARVAHLLGTDHCPDLLQRTRRTASQDHRGRDARLANLKGAIRAHPRRAAMALGRHVLLIDDVLTSGATLGQATEALLNAGAAEVSVLVVTRVAQLEPGIG